MGGNVQCIEGVKKLKRKEKSIYKPSDMWTTEDDLLFLRYCNNKRDRCYHAISRDSSCSPTELLKLRVKDVLFKQASGKQYAEILVNGKTGTRHIPLINSIPYLKDWLDEYPFSNNPNAPLLSGLRQSLGKYLNRTSLHETYARYKKDYFPKLLHNPAIAPEEKKKIKVLLTKPWNPYVRRHSALTEKSKILKEHILRQHAGWTGSSQMHLKYLHYYGNESNEAILEAYGLKPKDQETNKLQPVTCPNCGESNKIDSKFCAKCRMILSYDAYEETVNEQVRKVVDLDYVASLNERLKVLENKVK